MVFSYKPAKSIKAITYIIVGVLTLCSLIVQLFTFLFVPLFSMLTSKVTKRLQSFFAWLNGVEYITYVFTLQIQILGTFFNIISLSVDFFRQVSLFQIKNTQMMKFSPHHLGTLYLFAHSYCLLKYSCLNCFILRCDTSISSPLLK